MNNLISFPHLGNYYYPISRLLSLITKDKVMPAPPITKKTLELGTKYAPDTVCIPFKYNLGNFIESLEQGANVLFTAGGGCRYRYYAEVTETILKDLGYNFKFYKLIKQDMINWKDAYDIFKEINPNLTIPHFVHSIIYTILYIFYMDEIDKIIRKNIGFEIEKNAHQTLQKEMFNDFNKTSSKIEHLTDVVKEAVSNGHKILLFTSFRTALNIVKDNLTKEGITSYVIDGSVSSKKRQELVDKFNTDDTNIFLIMLKGGGTGLNLTSADIVIHLDLWWNPQAENQATDRAHRIGQKNTVEVIKLITKGTIEEKILDLQAKKKILSDKLIENDGDEYKSFQNLSVDDIRELLKFNNE